MIRWFKPKQSLPPLPDFSIMEHRVFAQLGTDIYIGGLKVTPEQRGRLRDAAKTLQTSELWEVLNASITHEAANLALIQSKDFDQVRFAKALHHWAHFFRNVIHTLAKD